MTLEEREALDRASLALRQLRCALILIRDAVPDPDTSDAIGLLEAFTESEAERIGALPI